MKGVLFSSSTENPLPHSPKGVAMSSPTDSAVRRALHSIKRTYAEMDRISRAMMDAQPRPTR